MTTVTAKEPRLLSCYVRLWAASTLFRVYMATGRGDPLSNPLRILTGTVLAAAVQPNHPWLVAAATGLRVWLFFVVGGPLSNSQNWAMHTDLTLLLAVLPHCFTLTLTTPPPSPRAGRRRGMRLLPALLTNEEEGRIVETVGPAIRAQVVIFYLASGVWKINSSFLHPEYSCASIYTASLIGHRLTSDPGVLRFVAKIAPLGTIVAELLLPLLQALPGTKLCGVAATLLFHFLIGVTPPPHNIAVFGVTTTTRLFFWIPNAVSSACAELVDLDGKKEKWPWLGPSMVVFAAVVVSGVRTPDGHGNPGLVGKAGVDWSLGFLCGVCVLFGRAIVIELNRRADTVTRSPTTMANNYDYGGGHRSSWLIRPMTTLALLYAFVWPMLGLQERGGCLMFSQLRLHGGSNHSWKLPTGLLQRMFSGNGDPRSALSGGVVRVQAFSSSGSVVGIDWVAQQFAEQMAPRTLDFLRTAGVKARYVPVPYYQPGPAGLPIVSKPGVFVPHTLSALGLRRMLERARAIGEPFSVRYVRLERPAEGDEAWRTGVSSDRSRLHDVVVILHEDPSTGHRRCRVRVRVRVGAEMPSLGPTPTRTPTKSRDCDAREVALIDPPTRHLWLTHWLMPMPNPIIEPYTSEMHCVSIS